MPQISTQDEILSYLQAHSTASVRDLSRALHTTLPNIRHHLDILLVDGKIEIGRKISSGGRGRPTILYILSSDTRKNNFIPLIQALLEIYLQDCPAEERDARLQILSQRLLGNPPRSKSGLTVRLSQAMAVLNGMAYQARWEAHAAGPQVFFSFCPYQAILSDHTELCLLDQAILQNLLQLPCTLIDRIDPLSADHPHCIFKVQVN